MYNQTEMMMMMVTFRQQELKLFENVYICVKWRENHKLDRKLIFLFNHLSDD